MDAPIISKSNRPNRHPASMHGAISSTSSIHHATPPSHPSIMPHRHYIHPPSYHHQSIELSQHKSNQPRILALPGWRRQRPNIEVVRGSRARDQGIRRIGGVQWQCILQQAGGATVRCVPIGIKFFFFVDFSRKGDYNSLLILTC